MNSVSGLIIWKEHPLRLWIETLSSPISLVFSLDAMELCLVERSSHPSLDCGELFLLGGKKGFITYWIAEELRRVIDKMLRSPDGHKPSINGLG